MTLRTATQLWKRRGNNAFISVWNTNNTSSGSSASNQIALPLVLGSSYSGTIDWGDGTTSDFTFANRTKTYSSAGTYTIKITGTSFVGFRFAVTGDRLKLLEIKNWGFISWTSSDVVSAFYGCTNLNVTANDGLDFEAMGVNTLFQFFRGCPALSLNTSYNLWNVKGVTIFGDIFRQTNFISPINNWDVRNATNLSMFNGSSYTQPRYDEILNSWTTLPLNVSVPLNVGTAKYSSAAAQSRLLLSRANNTVSISNAANNGSGLIRITSAAHGRTTGEKIFISGVIGTTEANGGWIVTVIDATTLDLQSSTFTNTYTSGGTLRTGYGWTITDGGLL